MSFDLCACNSWIDALNCDCHEHYNVRKLIKMYVTWQCGWYKNSLSICFMVHESNYTILGFYAGKCIIKWKNLQHCSRLFLFDFYEIYVSTQLSNLERPMFFHCICTQDCCFFEITHGNYRDSYFPSQLSHTDIFYLQKMYTDWRVEHTLGK